MDFIKSALEPDIQTDRAWYFIFSANDVLVAEKFSHSFAIPLMDKKSAAEMMLVNVRFLGTYNHMDCYCAGLGPDGRPQKGYRLINVRAVYSGIEPDVYRILGYARQIHDWNVNFQFCGRCGHHTRPNRTEHSRICPECRLVSYPRISPAIITAVVKGNRILLARGVNFPRKNMFSVLAGFVEPGEGLEDCLKREVCEETGIRVKHIRYFKSQPWPFPDSLMIGFTAEYDSGRILIDTREILEAGWFTKDNLPLVPGKPSLAGELIDWFVRTQG